MPWRQGGGRCAARGAGRRCRACATPSRANSPAARFANGRIDLTEAEGLAELLEAETEAQRDGALAPRRGRPARARSSDGGARCSSCRPRPRRRSIMPMRKMAAAAFEPRAATRARSPTSSAHWLAAPRVEPLRDGVRVVVAGPPNAGKSSLVNAIAGEASAPSSPRFPGTTRDLVEVPLAIGGVPFVLVDTAGLARHRRAGRAIGVGRARARDRPRRHPALAWRTRGRARASRADLVIASKADLDRAARRRRIAVSAVDRRGIARASSVDRRAGQSTSSGNEDELALNRARKPICSLNAARRCARAVTLERSVLVAEDLRIARTALDQVSGRAGVEDMLDALFGRFCLGKYVSRETSRLLIERQAQTNGAAMFDVLVIGAGHAGCEAAALRRGAARALRW